jgi:uncharacterized protein (DUF4415 family)
MGKKIQCEVYTLSSDVVECFKSTGSGWQSRIDAALRDWMTGHPLKRA